MLRLTSRLLALSLLVSQAACGSSLTGPFTPPESGGSPWIEVTSKHVILRTDLPAGEARETCAEFERIYSMFEEIAFPYAEKPRVHTTIVLFRREAEYAAIGPRGSVGFFRRPRAIDDAFEPVAVFYGDLTAATRLTFQHELTHRFIDFYFPKAPAWLHEGMADYYSTMQVEDNKVVLGRDLPNRFFTGGLSWFFQSTPMWPVIVNVPIGSARSVGDLVAMSREQFYAARPETWSPSEKEQAQKLQTANYASAWALVSLLQNGPAPYPELFRAYLEKLAANADPEAAFREVFASVEGRIQGDYQAWLAPTNRILRKAAYDLPPAQDVAERAMEPADVHVLWASIRPWREPVHRALARADLDAAIQLDPKNASARVWIAQLEEAEGRMVMAEAHLREAVTVAPDDPAATYALFALFVRQGAQSGPSERRWERADSLLPRVLSIATSPRVQNGAARYLAVRERTDDGLRLALRAVQGDPSCWQCFDTLALLLAQKGAFEKAVEAQSVAVSLMPEGMSSPSLTERLSRYKMAARNKNAATQLPCPPGADCLGKPPPPPQP